MMVPKIKLQCSCPNSVAVGDTTLEVFVIVTRLNKPRVSKDEMLEAEAGSVM